VGNEGEGEGGETTSDARDGGELLATARKLPPSQERHEILQKIGKMRAQIDALKAKGK
jgi:hypothetical protein